MTVAIKLCIQNSVIVDTSNICCDKVVLSLSMVPNCHYYQSITVLQFKVAAVTLKFINSVSPKVDDSSYVNLNETGFS